MSIEKQLLNIQNETNSLIQNISTDGNNNTKKKKFSFNSDKVKNIKKIFWNKKFLYSIPFIVSFLTLLGIRPQIIMIKTKKGKRKINWSKLFALTFIFTLIGDMGIFFLLKRKKN